MNTTRALGVMALTAALAAPAVVRAKAPEGPSFFFLRTLHEVKLKVDALGLSEAQKTQIKGIVRSRKDELRAAADRAFAAHEAVAEAMARDEVDEALIRQRVQEAAQAHAELAVLRAQVLHEARGVLTPAQREGAAGIRSYLRDSVRRFRTGAKAFVDDMLG